uniref:RBR-type E3 ubiquitin transferase n=1 Tax=Daphnia magna TaxID=35525 RepID=A0A0P4ZRV4_9CRUS
MSSMKHNPPRHSSNSLDNSQASMTLQATSQPGAGKGKSRKRKDHSPPSPSLPDGNSVVQQQQPCSLAIPITSSFSKPANKQGFRFSLRRMLYNSPLVSQRRSRSLSGGNNLGNPAPSSSSSTGGLRKRQSPCTSRYGSESPSDTSSTSQSELRVPSRSLRCPISENWECPLCLAECSSEFFPELLCCTHRSCLDCLQQYLRIEISESRVNINCPECSEPMHPNDIRLILNNETLLEKYEDFMLRRVLAADPDSRWCPAPDCNFVVLATGCASCPRLLCQRPGCGSSFCYHCKALWHPNQTCDAARAQRSSIYGSSSNFKNTQRDDIKPCPRCQVLIAKMDDGSCNHMTCALCGSEFCWLCMKEISDLHYLSPSGCTFWGKKPWSRKKKILWQLGTLVGAPVGIALLAGIAVPAMIIGIPIWVGRKLYARFKTVSKHKRNVIITSGVAASVLVAPAIAGVAVGMGVPILLAYIYGVVPVSLCQNGVCGVSASPLGVRIDFDDDDEVVGVGIVSGAAGVGNSGGTGVGSGSAGNGGGAGVGGGRGPTAYYSRGSAAGVGVGQNKRNTDAVSLDHATNLGLVGNPSIGEASVALSASGSASLGSASQLFVRDRDRESDREDCESASQLGLAGSIVSNASAARRLEVQAELVAMAACSPNKRSSFASSETASATISLSERSNTLSMADDGAASVASTRALAGSLLSYKMGDTSSVHSYRIPHTGQTSASASGSVKSGYAPVEIHACLNDGDDLASGARSSSPVSIISLSGDEVTLPGLVSLRRSARRARFGNNSTQAAGALAGDNEDHGQVRFDDQVSYFDRTTVACSPTAIEASERTATR